jgi:hypothetical protein
MAQKPVDFLSIADLLQSGTAKELETDGKIKEKLTAKGPHINIDFTQGHRVPFGLFKLKGKRNPLTVDIISLGNMIGFKKTMMFPLIMALDGEGKEVIGESALYDTREPAENLPMHIAASWKFTDAGNIEYIIVYPDMVSAKDTSLQTGSNKGIVVNALLSKMRVKKDAYARYHMSVC